MKYISLILVIATILTLLCACGAAQQQASAPAAAEDTPKAETAPQTENTPAAFQPGVKKSLKLLTIGNSWSIDAMWYLYDMLKEVGYEEVKLGIVYYSGCSLEKHVNFFENNSSEYDFYYNDAGFWNKKPGASLRNVLRNEQWDTVVFQQSAKDEGHPETYSASLPRLIDDVSQYLNPDTTFLWHLTWAFQGDYENSRFSTYYDNDQMKMYTMTADAVQTEIPKESRITGVIPVGTAIQNTRTSFIGDTLTRDGTHMNYYTGRYAAALTWCSYLSGQSPDSVKFNPNVDKITPDAEKAIKEAVTNALQTPYAVTASTVTTADALPEYADTYAHDTATAAANGIDLNNYELLEWGHLNNQFWSNTKCELTTPEAGATTENKYVAVDKMYSIEEIPAGSLFIVDPGWRYRLDVYKAPDKAYGGIRAEIINFQFRVLTEAYLRGCTNLTWTVQDVNGAVINDKFEEASTHLRIYVPKK